MGRGVFFDTKLFYLNVGYAPLSSEEFIIDQLLAGNLTLMLSRILFDLIFLLSICLMLVLKETEYGFHASGKIQRSLTYRPRFFSEEEHSVNCKSHYGNNYSAYVIERIAEYESECASDKTALIHIDEGLDRLKFGREVPYGDRIFDTGY